MTNHDLDQNRLGRLLSLATLGLGLGAGIAHAGDVVPLALPGGSGSDGAALRTAPPPMRYGSPANARVSQLPEARVACVPCGGATCNLSWS